MNELKKIKKRRSDKNADITLYYTCTASAIDDNWSYEEHQPKPITGDHLSLIDWWIESSNTVNFEFAVYERVNGSLKRNKKKTLSVLYSKWMKCIYATLCFETTTQELRKERIEEILVNA